VVRESKHACNTVELCYFGHVSTMRGRSMHIEKMQDFTSNGIFFLIILYFYFIGHNVALMWDNNYLQVFDDFIFAFFSLEMIVKMIAMGAYGPCTYLADSWNRLDFFIVIAGYVTIYKFINKLVSFVFCIIQHIMCTRD